VSVIINVYVFTHQFHGGLALHFDDLHVYAVNGFLVLDIRRRALVIAQAAGQPVFAGREHAAAVVVDEDGVGHLYVIRSPLAICKGTGYKWFDMPKTETYEYGQLQKRGKEFWFYSNDSDSGRPVTAHIHQVLNSLAASRWEPCFYYEEREDSDLLPTWIMRRPDQAVAKPLTAEEQKAWKPTSYRTGKSEQDDD
jgi:hypothetical protein